MSTPVVPTPFQSGFRTIDGQALDTSFAMPQVSSEYGITAHAAGGKTNAYKITAVLSEVTTVATTADSVILPASAPGYEFTLVNSGANSMQVFGTGTDTINSVATGTGISQPAGTTYVYNCATAGNWTQNGAASGSFTGAVNGIVGGVTPAAGTFTTLTANTKLVYTGVRVGTFVCNGATPVTVTNANITANSMVFISLNTVGGTVGAIPHVATITAATGFTTVGTASDTSTYNYMIVEAA